ncbi:hypothetical protein NDU88_002964 [Pleurodeles waltl]|uniref:Uncharacterized protein n=1 Tax=Pleurodeles waltl TaxID=8319 RepID=A0AAV7TM94_PLEWA|nr:hypothetical protein NDU88_002964 [Pleurodeles waltl]
MEEDAVAGLFKGPHHQGRQQRPAEEDASGSPDDEDNSQEKDHCRLLNRGTRNQEEAFCSSRPCSGERGHSRERKEKENKKKKKKEERKTREIAEGQSDSKKKNHKERLAAERRKESEDEEKSHPENDRRKEKRGGA